MHQTGPFNFFFLSKSPIPAVFPTQGPAPMYQYSLEAFEVVFLKALAKAEPADTVQQRVANILRRGDP